MGINNLYREIGPGERIALSKLAAEHIERLNRPFRLAIDISIWSFQNQAANGGKNPELRTLYYRLVRLLSLSIEPLFVFDGPNKPPFKRGVRTNPNSAAASAYFSQNTKEMLALFGFPIHQAPGEAEAECAFLQRNGIVDAVLSEDVDTLMFGCTIHLRNWSSASTKGKTPTHVDLYRSETTLAKYGLDHNGMILVALMSGGDYLPGGLQGCGPKIACEAAKGGFGTELCKLSDGDDQGFDEWRDWLQHELSTNEGGYFKRSHKNLKIPDSFPDRTILRYYTHPVTSSTQDVEQISQRLDWNQVVNILQLRLFVAEMFEWENFSGAKKFIRTLAPALLVHQLRKRASEHDDDLKLQELNEKRLVKAIHGRRHHYDTDGTAELRVSFIPAEIVKLDLEEEQDATVFVDNDTNTDSEQGEHGSDSQRDVIQSPRKPRASPRYNPLETQKMWVLETFVKIGIPLMSETWEEDMRNPKKFAGRKVNERAKSTKRPKAKVTNGGMKRGALDSFVKLTKPGTLLSYAETNVSSEYMVKSAKEQEINPATSQMVEAETRNAAIPKSAMRKNQNPPRGDEIRRKPLIKAVTTTSIIVSTSTSTASVERDNPWTKSKRPRDTYDVKLPSGTRYSALGIYSSEDGADQGSGKAGTREHGIGRPSASFPASPSNPKKHARPTSGSPDRKSVESRSQRQASRGDDEITLSRNEVIHLDITIADESDPTRPLSDDAKTGIRSRVHSPQMLKTPNTTRGRLQHNPRGPSPTPTARKVNRRLDFNHSHGSTISPASDTDSLPSPSQLFSATKASQSTQRTSVSPSPKKGPTKPKDLVMARESLPGAWRDVKPWETLGRPSKVMASVDVIDLT